MSNEERKCGGSRAQAMADGTLFDFSESARKLGFTRPIALTEAAWARCVAMTRASACIGATTEWRVKQLFAQLGIAIVTGRPNQTVHHFKAHTYAFRASVWNCFPVDLKCVAGMGDAGEPVHTIMLAEED